MPAGHLNKTTTHTIVKPLCRFAVLLACFFAATTLRAQSIPCLLGRGRAPNSWERDRDDNTTIGRLLYAAEMEQDGSRVQAIYRTALDDAEQLPDTDTCKARAFFYIAFYYQETGDARKALTLQQRVVAIVATALPAGMRDLFAT